MIKQSKTHSFTIEVDEIMVMRFCHLSGDFNTIHFSDEVDKALHRNKQPIAHGALQVAWVSQAVGKYLIGDGCLIYTIKSRFMLPLVYPCSVIISSYLKHWSEEKKCGLARVTVSGSDKTFSEHILELGIKND